VPTGLALARKLPRVFVNGGHVVVEIRVDAVVRSLRLERAEDFVSARDAREVVVAVIGGGFFSFSTALVGMMLQNRFSI